VKVDEHFAHPVVERRFVLAREEVMPIALDEAPRTVLVKARRDIAHGFREPSPITYFASANSGTARSRSRQAFCRHEAMSRVESMSVPSQSKMRSW
jgi:hypothetical protein